MDKTYKHHSPVFPLVPYRTCSYRIVLSSLSLLAPLNKQFHHGPDGGGIDTRVLRNSAGYHLHLDAGQGVTVSVVAGREGLRAVPEVEVPEVACILIDVAHQHHVPGLGLRDGGSGRGTKEEGGQAQRASARTPPRTSRWSLPLTRFRSNLLNMKLPSFCRLRRCAAAVIYSHVEHVAFVP